MDDIETVVIDESWTRVFGRNETYMIDSSTITHPSIRQVLDHHFDRYRGICYSLFQVEVEDDDGSKVLHTHSNYVVLSINAEGKKIATGLIAPGYKSVDAQSGIAATNNPVEALTHNGMYHGEW